jgi:Myb-like DNA-binding domain
MAKQGNNPLVKAEDGIVKNEDGTTLKAGDHRATPCRWSSHEKKKFIELIKLMGKQFAKIAEIIKTKNEQQCRTKALILYNKLKVNNFDNKLFEILAPTKPTPTSETTIKKKKRYVPKVKTDQTGDLIKSENPEGRASSVEPEEISDADNLSKKQNGEKTDKEDGDQTKTQMDEIKNNFL